MKRVIHYEFSGWVSIPVEIEYDSDPFEDMADDIDKILDAEDKYYDKARALLREKIGDIAYDFDFEGTSWE